MSRDGSPRDHGAGSDASGDEALGRVLDAYLAGLEAGRAPDPERLLAEHPGLADGLRACLGVMHLADDGPSGTRVDDAATSGPMGRSALTTLWAGRRDSAPHVLLREPAPGGGPVVRPAGDAMRGAPGNGRGRYHLLGEIARGGMGAVLKGRDDDLGRDLAVKVLLDRHRGDPEMLRRFVEEAQIGGQLQHPGIVPVYELGTFPDRRPYFAMKLVQGRTLAALLRERPGPAADRPRFLSVFESVCQTVAYAHARGVIHRDLKPSNVMVGSFGEVQVMDWGLAKLLAEGGADDDEASAPSRREPTVRTVRSGSSGDESAAGSVLGTPAYMAPEQARGEMDRLDERADVFGLGAILCEVLTGAPPYSGGSLLEVRDRAARADLGDALGRVDACGADAELVALGRACLAADPAARPRDAGDVARRVTAHLAGVQERLRVAEIARVEAQARAETERQRRRLTLGLAASVLALIGTAAGAWIYLESGRRAGERRVYAAYAGANSRLGRARGSKGDAAAWAEARTAAEGLDALLATVRVGAELRRDVAGLTADVRREADEAARAAEADRRDRELLGRLEKIRGGVAPDRARSYLDTLRWYGLDVEATDDAEALASRVTGRPEAVRQAIAAALDDWAFLSRSLRSEAGVWKKRLALASAIDPEPARVQMRRAWVERDLVTLKRLAEPDIVGDLRPASVTLLASLLKADDRARAERVLRDGALRHPHDAWVNFELAALLARGSPEERTEAIGYFRAARALSPDLGSGLSTHLNDHRGPHLGQPAEIEAINRELVARHPDSIADLSNLAMMLNDQGKKAEAAQYLARALELGRAQLKRQANDAGLHYRLGDILLNLGRWAEAESEYRLTLKSTPPVDAVNSAAFHFNLGNALLAQGKRGEAIEEFRTTLRLNPNGAGGHAYLGRALRASGDRDGAIEEFRIAIRLQPGYALAHYNLSSILRDSGDLAGAERECREAVRLEPQANFYRWVLGGILRLQGRYREALVELRRSRELASPAPGITWLLAKEEMEAEIRLVEGLAARADRLPGVLAGTDRPEDATEGLVFSQLAHHKGSYAASARLYGDALAAEPRLGDDREAQHRYNAACAAALAGTGHAKDDPQPDEAARAKLRAQALGWLRAELAAWENVAMTAEPGSRPLVAKTLEHWKADPDLAGVRDAGALASLPEAERADWATLWAEVDRLKRRAAGAR